MINDCKMLYKEMYNKDISNQRITLQEYYTSLELENKKYRRVFYVILDKLGNNINMNHLEKLHLFLYVSETNEYLLYYDRKCIELDCPPSHYDISEFLYKKSKMDLILFLYSLFSKRCISIRKLRSIDAYNAAAYNAADVAYNAAAYNAADVAYNNASDAAAAAAEGASEAAYDAYNAYDTADDYDAYDAAYEAARASSRKAFKKLITLKKTLLEGGA